MKLVTAPEMRDLDARASQEYAIPSLLLMENAGRAVAEHALQMLGPGSRRRVAVYCGKGNNGGDGLVAARYLANAGCEIRLFLSASALQMRGDAGANLEIARRMDMPLTGLESPPPEPWPADLALDAVLGTGIRGEVTGGAAVLIGALKSSGCPVLAVDLPSGLDSDSGRLASTCVRADCTVTMALPKLGLALYPGREAAGRIEVADIGMPRALLDAPEVRTWWLDREHVALLLSPRPPTAHKGDAGRVLLLAGSEGMAGAAALSSEGAVRGGAGLVTLGCPRSLIDVMAAKLTEVMTAPLAETETRALDLDALDTVRARGAQADALALGPGLGRHPRTGELVHALVGSWDRPIVIDADALSLLSPAAGTTFPAQAVLTPHPGELARLLGSTIPAVEADRVAAARDAARQFGCVVLLKGAATLIADPEGRLGVNSTGTPAMATGGCGDVLTGLIAALLAQGLAPFEAACAGAYLHGLAGELAERRFGGPGIAAGDLLPELPAARASLRAGP
jgi:hydroxyethylthiazole kinase-like uncharacterized protein yjeF